MTTETQTTLYRHPSDVARLTFSLVALAVLLLLAVLQNTQLAKISTDILELFSGLPDALVNGLVGLVQLLATLMPVVVVFALFRSRSWQLSLLMVLASLIAAVTMALLTGVVDASVPASSWGSTRSTRGSSGASTRRPPIWRC